MAPPFALAWLCEYNRSFETGEFNIEALNPTTLKPSDLKGLTFTIDKKYTFENLPGWWSSYGKCYILQPSGSLIIML